MNFNSSPEEKVRQVVATLAIENMHVPKDFQQELLYVAQGKKSSSALISELDKKYMKA